jgi:cell division protein FtsB
MSMIGTSTSGYAQHKNRSLDLEANLLAERIEEHERVYAVSKKRIITIVLILFISAFVLPYIHNSQVKAIQNAKSANAKVSALTKEFSTIQQNHVETTQQLAIQAMKDKALVRSRLFTGSLIQVLNNAPSSIALSGLRAEVIGGELQIRGAADAESLTAARSYIQSCGNHPSAIESLLVSAKRNDMLGTGGIQFEFVHRTGVTH